MLTRDLRDFFPEATTLGFDLETTGLSPWQDHITAITVSDGERAVVVDVRLPQLARHPVRAEIASRSGDVTRHLARVGDWLRRSVYHQPDGTPRRIVVHHSMFDLPFVKEYYGVDYPAEIWDTQLAETLLTAGMVDPENPKRTLSRSLQAAVRRRLGVEMVKDADIRLGFLLDNVWSPEQIRYAEDDAKLLIPLMQGQEREIYRQGMEMVTRIEMQAALVFAEMYRVGVQVDREGLIPLLEDAKGKAAVEQARLERLLTKHVLWERKRRNAESEAVYAAWRERFDAAEREFGKLWDACHDDPAIQAEWREIWVGREKDPAKDGSPRFVTAKEVDGWFDPTLDRKDQLPKGRKRFVKSMLYFWRREEGNAAPDVKVVEVHAPINVNSNPQKRAAIADYLEAFNRAHGTDITMPKNLEKGTLVAMSVDAPPPVREELLAPLLEYSRWNKLVTSFGEPLLNQLRPGNLLSGSWRQIGTATGRPSCSSPNLLNQPNDDDFRGKYVAREGHLFIIADQSQVELRILAELSQDGGMIRAFREDKDFHALTAADMYGVALDQVTDPQRKTAKAINFGRAYGLQEQGLRRNLAALKIFISTAEAKEMLALYRRRYAPSTSWIEEQGNLALSRGWTATAMGRRRYFDVPHGFVPPHVAGAIQRQGANHPIQGTNADITKLAMIMVQQVLAPLGGRILMQVYDEIVCEVPASHAWEAKRLVQHAMLAAMHTVLKTVPAKCDCVISPSWSEAAGKAWEAASVEAA